MAQYINLPQFELCSYVNSMIVGWIRSSIEACVRSIVTFISDFHELWENSKKHFSVGNKVKIHHLNEEIASCKQDEQTVMDYFGRLAKMWEELDTYKPLPPCSCSASAIYETGREEEKVHQFIMGLDEARFGIVCRGIIATDSSVDLSRAYAWIVTEKQQLTSTKEQEAQHNDVGFVATKEPSETKKFLTDPSCSHFLPLRPTWSWEKTIVGNL